MKEIQHSLSFPAEQAPTRIKAGIVAKASGRPRRIPPLFAMEDKDWLEAIEAIESTTDYPSDVLKKYGIRPEIIKISLSAQAIASIEKKRSRMEGSATVPDVIRTAVKHLADNPPLRPAGLKVAAVVKAVGRCEYVKVLFPPEMLIQIGHQPIGEKEAHGLCKDLGLSRQQVILLAIRLFIGGDK